MRAVLRVKNRNYFSARKLKRVVQCLRLGARPARGHENQFIIGRQRPSSDLSNRIEIVLLTHKFDIQLAARPVEPIKRGQQLPDHGLLAIERHQN
ncbi:hypothetical protein D9M72_559720 [compost metagenome]